MRRFLICSGVHGQLETLDRLERLVRQRNPDGLLFIGGVLARSREYSCTLNTSFGYTKDETIFVERFFSTLGKLDVFSAIVPGVFDAPLDLFLDLGMKAELKYPRLHLVHSTPYAQGDVAFFGLGACINDYTDMNIGYYSRRLANYYLRALRTINHSRTILLLSEPPESWHGDAENRKLTESLIGKYHPEVCALEDPSRRRGIERIAGTLLINPGYLSDGSAAWLDWNRPGDDQVELIDLSQSSLEPAPHPESLPKAPRVVVANAMRS